MLNLVCAIVGHPNKNLADAVKFYEQCVAIQSPYLPLATASLKGLRSAYRVVK